MAYKINKVSTCVNKVKWTYIQILINIKRYNIPPAKINRILKETILNNDIELFKIVRKYEYTMQWEKWEKLEQFDQSEIIDWGDALYYAILHKRIKILKESDDGFYIAEEDMQLRGFGDIIGYQQSGVKNFRFADPVAHEDLFVLAEKYIKNININVNESKYAFLLKLFDKAEIINQNID